jgi:hypothetical protein
MIGFQYFAGAFADNNAGSHYVGYRRARHDGTMGETHVFDSIGLELGIYLCPLPPRRAA